MGACHLVCRMGTEIQSQMGKQHPERPTNVGRCQPSQAHWVTRRELEAESISGPPAGSTGAPTRKLSSHNFCSCSAKCIQGTGDNDSTPAVTSPAGSGLRPRPGKHRAVIRWARRLRRWSKTAHFLSYRVREAIGLESRALKEQNSQSAGKGHSPHRKHLSASV